MHTPRGRLVDGRAVARFLVRTARRALLTLGGVMLILLGLLGLVLPVLPGWVLIIGGFALLSREYLWAHSCLAFCKRHAAKGSGKVKELATRRRRAPVVEREIVLPSDEVVIDLTTPQAEAAEYDAESRSA